jgi:hypothetical protein
MSQEMHTEILGRGPLLQLPTGRWRSVNHVMFHLTSTLFNLPVFVTLTESDNCFASIKGGGNGQRLICLARNDKGNQCL